VLLHIDRWGTLASSAASLRARPGRDNIVQRYNSSKDLGSPGERVWRRNGLEVARSPTLVNEII